MLAAALPLFLAVNATRVLLTERYVRAAYPHLRRDDVLSERRRVAFALLGLRAVDPVRGASVSILRAPRLPDGTQAFTARELRHMRDVRAWLWRMLVFELAVAVALVGVGVRSRALLARALRAGGLATLGVGVLVVLAMVVDFHDVLLGFHKLLFAGNSWHFSDQDTLIRVYPEAFWKLTGIAIGLLVLAQAAAAFALGQAMGRSSRTART